MGLNIQEQVKNMCGNYKIPVSVNTAQSQGLMAPTLQYPLPTLKSTVYCFILSQFKKKIDQMANCPTPPEK